MLATGVVLASTIRETPNPFMNSLGQIHLSDPSAQALKVISFDFSAQYADHHLHH